MPLDLSAIDTTPPPAESRAAQAKSVEQKRKGLNPFLVAAPAMGQGFDAFTTQLNLHDGATEANPVLEPFASNPAASTAAKLALGVGLGLAANQMAKGGHSNRAKLLAVLGTALPVAAGALNLSRR